MSKPLVQQVCERARGLVDNPRTWTQYAIARTGNNKACDPTDVRAARFCAYGALLRAAYDIAGDNDQTMLLVDRSALLLTGHDSPLSAFEDLIVTNDGPRGSARQAVLELFDKALAKH